MATIPLYPYGYKLNYKGSKELDLERAKIVELIYEKYVGGLNRYAIMAYLIESKVLRPRGDSYEWQYSMVDRILQDERYIGSEKYPQIITLKLFEKAKSQRESDRRKADECRSIGCLTEKKYPFTGFIVCGHCGCFYRRGTQGKDRKKTNRVSWKCAKYIELGVEKCKQGGNIYEQILDTVCIKVYNRILGNKDLIDVAIVPAHKLVKKDKDLDDINVLINEVITKMKDANEKEFSELEETLNLLISRRSSIEWGNNELDLSPFQTTKINIYLDENPELMVTFDEERFKAIVEKLVTIEPGKIKVILKNGVEIIEEYIPMRGQVKNAKKCGSNTSEN